jgi:exonuclease I
VPLNSSDAHEALADVRATIGLLQAMSSQKLCPPSLVDNLWTSA